MLFQTSGNVRQTDRQTDNAFTSRIMFLYNAAALGNRIATFRNNVLPSYLKASWLLKKATNHMVVICFLLGNSPASEIYIPTFRNAQFHLHRQVGVKKHTYLPMKMEQTVCSETRRKFEIKKPHG